MRDETNHAAEQLSAYSQAYWKCCTILLGIALMISLVIHAGGPTGTRAAPGLTGENLPEKSAVPVSGGGFLSVGGFEALDGLPYFVIRDADGHRVGALPMTAASRLSDLTD